jgi:hypothetical protein
MEPDFYTNPEAISTAGWDALSVTIFEQTCTAPTGGRFGNIFDQPDLTTGTPLAHARAQLFELQTALATAKRSRRQDPVFKIYVRSMMDELLAMPPLLEAIHNDHSGAFRIVAAFLDDHHPEWSEGLSKNRHSVPCCPCLSTGMATSISSAWCRTRAPACPPKRWVSRRSSSDSMPDAAMAVPSGLERRPAKPMPMRW